jgi:hypothetical protein
MRIALFIVSLFCMLIPTCLLVAWAFIDCFFRDGMGPKSVSSGGFDALARFWWDFKFPFYYYAPIILVGIGCTYLSWPHRRNAKRTDSNDTQTAA